MSTSSDIWSPRSFWRFNIVIWSIFTVFEFSSRYFVFFHEDIGRALTMTLWQEPVAFAIAGGLYYLYRYLRLTDLTHAKTIMWIGLLSIGAGLLQATFSSFFIAMTGWHNDGWTAREEWMVRFIFVSFVYLAWSLVFFGLVARQREKSASELAKAASEEAQRIELQLLRSQLDPHFLFNSLNGIAAEIEPHPKAAFAMVCELSDYLRYSLEQRHRVAAPLSAELAGVSAYLRIEQARFGDRLNTSVEADAESRRRLVPSFLLQPLVENAVKHGMKADTPQWKLSIHASVRDGTLSIAVMNSGELVTQPATSTGLGLETLRRRLILHYPDRHHFALENHDGAVRASLELKGDPCFA